MKELLLTLALSFTLTSAQAQYLVFCSNQPDTLGYCEENYAFTLPSESYIYALCDMEYDMLFDTIIYYEIYSIDDEGMHTYESTVEQIVDMEWAWFWMPIQLPRSGTYEIVVMDDYGMEFGDPIASEQVIVDFE